MSALFNHTKVIPKIVEGHLENLFTTFGNYFLIAENSKLCDWNWVTNLFENIPTGLSNFWSNTQNTVIFPTSYLYETVFSADAL